MENLLERPKTLEKPRSGASSKESHNQSETFEDLETPLWPRRRYTSFSEILELHQREQPLCLSLWEQEAVHAFLKHCHSNEREQIFSVLVSKIESYIELVDSGRGNRGHASAARDNLLYAFAIGKGLERAEPLSPYLELKELQRETLGQLSTAGATEAGFGLIAAYEKFREELSLKRK